MTWAIFAFFPHLVFIPGLYDGFSLPKRVYVFGLGIAAVIFLFSKRRELPLVGLISSYLVVSMIPFLWVANVPVFMERVALDAACFAVFWAVAGSTLNEDRISIILLLVGTIAVIVIGAAHFFPMYYGTMGNIAYTAFVASQASPLSLAGGFLTTVIAAVALAILAMGSRAAFLAAILSLFAFGAAKIISIRYFFYAAVLVVILSPMLARYDFPRFKDTRKDLWQNSVHVLQKPHEWIFGIGRGQFEIQYPAFANKKVLDTREGNAVTAERFILWGHPHNEFLNSVIETGVLGSALFWLIILFLVEPARRNNRTDLAITCSLLGTILFSAFWFPFSHPSMAITFWALAGLLWADTFDGL